jgi:hypothetical protein
VVGAQWRPHGVVRRGGADGRAASGRNQDIDCVQGKHAGARAREESRLIEANSEQQRRGNAFGPSPRRAESSRRLYRPHHPPRPWIHPPLAPKVSVCRHAQTQMRREQAAPCPASMRRKDRARHVRLVRPLARRARPQSSPCASACSIAPPLCRPPSDRAPTERASHGARQTRETPGEGQCGRVW